MDNATPEMSEKLVQYLDGELTGVEKENLAQLLLSDKDLQDKLTSLQATREAVKIYGLQQKVAGIRRQMMEEMQPPVKRIGFSKKIIRYSISVAASLLVLISGYLAYNFFTLSPEKVFSSRYQPYQLVTLRDGSANETTMEKAFREKNYQEVLRINDTGKDHTQKEIFLSGVAAIELNDNNKAITCFKEVLTANEQAKQSLLNDESEYYLSLSYIRNKDYDNALALLNKIKGDPGHLYYEKITGKLIRQVKMLRRR